MYELVLQFLTQIFGLMYSVLTEDLSDFSPHAYEYISILNTILKGFASVMMQTLSISYSELKYTRMRAG